MSRKKHRNDELKQNQNKDQRSKTPLFSQVDAKSVEVSGYTLGHGAPQTDQEMHEHAIPTGVVGIDESIVLSTLSSHSNREYSSKPHKTIRYSQIYNKEPIHLPPITHQHYPYEYFPVQPNSHHAENLYHSHPIHHRHQSFHNHYRLRHKHGETYDPRWWYMPLNSVHGPRSHRFIEHHHYIPPKWYEIPSRQ